MTPPTDKQQLASFIGMVTYMGNFVPHLSHHTEPLRAMLKQEAVFAWMKWQMPASRRSRISLPRVPPSHSDTMTEGNQSQYRRMPPKEDLVRAFYRMASQSHTPARASQTLRPGTQTSKESSLPLYSLVNGSTPTCRGRPFTVESDHKPLEMIHQKSLASAPPTPANAPAVTAIRCDHQIQTREGNAARLCTEQVPLTSFWGNQTGYESRLHCLQQELDSQTQGHHQGRPHSWHGLPAHSAGVATPKEAYSVNGQGIL